MKLMPPEPLGKCQCSECDCNTQTIEHPCSNCQDGRHTNVGFFELILKEKKEMTPKSGYNVCIFDDFSPMGEKLELIAWYADKESAVGNARTLREAGHKVHILH